jgi:homocysteine S-methyltransferase
VARIRAVTTLPIVAYPNSGEGWDAASRRWTDAAAADAVDASAALGWVAAGARLVGGCCRVRPGQIAVISAGLAAAAR